jgi:hypothetical protein
VTQPDPLTPSLSATDLVYVRGHYRTLDQLTAGRSTPSLAGAEDWVASGLLPQPTYVLPDGIPVFPPDLLALVDDAGSIDALPTHFATRVRTALVAPNATMSTDDLDHHRAEHWDGYLSGQYGVCLWNVAPEAMVRKETLIATIADLLAAPSDSVGQKPLLAAAVDELDALLRPFTDYDRQRWGGTSRDTYVTDVRRTHLAGEKPRDVTRR